MSWKFVGNMYYMNIQLSPLSLYPFFLISSQSCALGYNSITLHTLYIKSLKRKNKCFFNNKIQLYLPYYLYFTYKPSKSFQYFTILKCWYSQFSFLEFFMLVHFEGSEASRSQQHCSCPTRSGNKVNIFFWTLINSIP